MASIINNIGPITTKPPAQTYNGQGLTTLNLDGLFTADMKRFGFDSNRLI